MRAIENSQLKSLTSKCIADMHSANNKHDVIREEMQIYEFEKEREITLLKKDYE